jgi:hypothetical protein
MFHGDASCFFKESTIFQSVQAMATSKISIHAKPTEHTEKSIQQTNHRLIETQIPGDCSIGKMVFKLFLTIWFLCTMLPFLLLW